MWIARDKDGGLFLYDYKPTKDEEVWIPHGGSIEIDKNSCLDVKWEDEEPTEVELVIKRKEA